MKTFPGLPTVDRRLFLPDDIIVSVEVPFERWPERVKETMQPGGRLHEHVRISRKDDPKEWERWVDSDEAITTRVKGEGEWPSSSSSAPWLMARMIEALDLEAAMRVSEIGTGTGWNAGCLAALGAEVVSIEVQEDVADQARAAFHVVAGVLVPAQPAQHDAVEGGVGLPAAAAVETVPVCLAAGGGDGSDAAQHGEGGF